MPAPQQQGNNNDNSLDFLWLVAMIVVGIGLIWYFGHSYITAFFYLVRYYEIIAISFVLNGWNMLAAFLHLPTVDMSDIQQWKVLIENRTISDNFASLQGVSNDVGVYLRYPVTLLLIILAILIYSKNVTLKFKNIFDMKRLRLSEQSDWPQITPIINLDLVKTDLDEGPWAMAMTPMQFCKRFNLLQEEIVDEKLTVKVLKGAAQNVFTTQLGPLWTGFNGLPVHVKTLLGVFAACANQDREIAAELLAQISTSATHGKLNFAGGIELLNKHKDSKLVQRVVQSHAYLLTVMQSMLMLARTDGVLACSDFLWLKPLDRRLWYVLNTVGRQTAVAEAAGPFAHWLAERKLGRALQVPMVEQAIVGLELAITEIIYEPEEN